MTMVFLTAVLDLLILDNNELHNIADNIRANIVSPNIAKLSMISCVYCKKNMNANNIRAGNANLLKVLLVLAAVSG